MPELPEVETIRLKLQKYLAGHIVEKVEIRNNKQFTGDKDKLIGGIIKDVRRFGKVQSIDLANGFSILIHIKMTGQLIYKGPNLKKLNLSKKVTGGVGGKHTHIIFYLDKGGKLYFNDVRKFGWIRIVKTDQVEKDKFIANLGPEPFANAQGKPGILNFDYFKTILSKSSRPIKVVLMDQTKIGGIGNIYANDALWQSCINPKRPGKSLKTDEQKELFEAIHEVLKKGIKYGGASENAFVSPDGSEGEYQDHNLIYGHEGEKCRRCKKSKITKYFLAGRGTYVCSNCQK